MTKIQIWQMLNQMGVNKPLTEIEAALVAIDRQALLAEQRGRFRVEVWDKTSPINGVEPEKIVSSHGLNPDDRVYLIYVDGNLVYLQPHNPFSGGLVRLTAEDVVQVAKRHVDQLVDQAVDGIIMQMAMEKLLA